MKLQKVVHGIYRWGIYPALILLREMQGSERYEECAIIKQAIDSVREGREQYFSTSVDDDSLAYSFKNLLDGHHRSDVIRNNMPFYIDAFREYVDSD